MIFNTSWFILFFAIVYPVFLLVGGREYRYWFVLAMSAVFHIHFAGAAGVAPIVAMGLMVYWVGAKMALVQGKRRLRWFQFGLLSPVMGLVYYKYRVFFLSQVVSLLPASEGVLRPLMAESPMPLAISFFTFEFVHYLYEVYKGGEPIRRLSRFALFSVYFPSIVAGPIKRYRHFMDQVSHGIARPANVAMVGEGFAQVLLGFFKKLVIADNVALLIHLMEDRQDWGASQVLILGGLLCIRILFDFSGYSDMAIGLSRMFGIELPRNFNFPYKATNPADFWRRWHMSLSTWIRDYVYIPLGGSRQGPARKVVNLLAAMGLCGLWHGAAWNFIVWGLYNGLGLVSHSVFRQRWPAPENPSRLATMTAVFFNLVFVAYGWILFFYPMEKVGYFTARLLGLD